MVIAPCKGFDVDLEQNLRALVRQDYHDYEVTFVVESADDPACPIIRGVMAEHPRAAARLLVAGRATEGGQKVHNLRAATAEVAPEIRYLAFADSDAQPRPEWLRAAIAPLAGGEAAAVTGYRWFIPERSTLANHLLYSINCRLMSLVGKRSHYLVWGGSWAIQRETFDELRLHAAWRGTLSDDLVASQVLRRGRRCVRFQPECVVGSPADYSISDMIAFVRRQYVISRCYAADWWAFGLLVSTLRQAAWACTVAALASSVFWSALPWWIPAACLAFLYAFNVGCGWLIQDLAKVYFREKSATDALRRARRFDLWAAPIAGAVHWLALVSSIWGRHIAWRNIRYRLFRGGQAAIAGREEGPSRAAQAEPLHRAA